MGDEILRVYGDKNSILLKYCINSLVFSRSHSSSNFWSKYRSNFYSSSKLKHFWLGVFSSFSFLFWGWLPPTLMKLNTFINLQKELGEEEDHLFLVSQGLLDNNDTRRSGNVRSANSKILSLQRFKPPYFSNKYKIGPRLNPDQIALSTNPRYQV